MSLIRLRPHHLICNLCFSGKGYNEKFVKNFTKINKKLQENNAAKIKIVASCDDICVKCPKNQNQVCEDEKTVLALDKAFLQTLGLQFGQTITAKNLDEKIKSKVSLSRAQSICKNCSWYDVICRQILVEVLH